MRGRGVGCGVCGGVKCVVSPTKSNRGFIESTGRRFLRARSCAQDKRINSLTSQANIPCGPKAVRGFAND